MSSGAEDQASSSNADLSNAMEGVEIDSSTAAAAAAAAAGGQGQEQGEEQSDDEDDEAPVFIEADEVTEEILINDDDDVPMDDDDDEENGENGNEQQGEIEDASPHVKIECHRGPIYAVAINKGASEDGSLLIATGGGDDVGFLSAINPTTAAAAAAAALLPTPPPTDITLPPATVTTDNFSTFSPHSTSIKLEGHAESVSSSAWSFDHALLATGSYDGVIKIWDKSGKNTRSLEGPSDVEWMKWHAAGHVLIVGSTDGTIWMFLVRDGSCMQVFAGHEGEVTSGGFSGDGKFVVSCSADGSLRVWAPKSGACKGVLKLSEHPLNCLAFGDTTINKALALVGGIEGKAWVVNVANKKEFACLNHADGSVSENSDEGGDNSVECVGFCKSASVNWCATAGIDGVVKIWDIGSGVSCRHSLVGESGGGLTKIVWHERLWHLLYASCSHGVITLWDCRAGGAISVLKGHTDMILDFDYKAGAGESEGDDVLVSGGDDMVLRVWNVKTVAAL
jgi:WD40 repeat protein